MFKPWVSQGPILSRLIPAFLVLFTWAHQEPEVAGWLENPPLEFDDFPIEMSMFEGTSWPSLNTHDGS